MGRDYASMNPRRESRPELTRCHCTKCGKTLYFNLKRHTFQNDLPLGGAGVEDPHRPRCNKCLALGKVPLRSALRAKVWHKNPLRAPIPVRIKLEGVNADPNQIIAAKYTCPHQVIWKTPNGQVLYQWYRRPGKSPKQRWSGIHFKRQFGTIYLEERKRGPSVWVYRFFARGVRRKVRIGTTEQYRTREQATEAARGAVGLGLAGRPGSKSRAVESPH
jgi:hypothetical protein